MRISDWSSDVCSSDLKLDQPDQLVHRRALGTHRGRFLNDMLDTGALAGIIGCTPDDLTLYDLALTHGSTGRSEEHTSELQSLMRISYAVFCLKKKQKLQKTLTSH